GRELEDPELLLRHATEDGDDVGMVPPPLGPDPLAEGINGIVPARLLAGLGVRQLREEVQELAADIFDGQLGIRVGEFAGIVDEHTSHESVPPGELSSQKGRAARTPTSV